MVVQAWQPPNKLKPLRNTLKKKPKKDYIKWFDNWNDLEPMDEFQKAYYITTME